MSQGLRFSALRLGPLTLHRIREDNLAYVRSLFGGFVDSPYMLGELEANYRPDYDQERRQTLYGFYTTFHDTLAGGSLLGISSWAEARGFTGADTFVHMRGRGVAPASKPLLFYLGFELLGLNRIETGCFVSNVSSRRSIEKTRGFELEGTLRQYARNTDGLFVDEHRYAILRCDWLRLYDKREIELVL
jgi:RimJ/RimL family protein N-acetyltransferase